MYNAKRFILQMNADLVNFLFWNFVSLKVSKTILTTVLIWKFSFQITIYYIIN